MQEDIVGFDGTVVNLNLLPSSDPNKFALHLVRQMKGPDYFKSHVFDPSTDRSLKQHADADTIHTIKRAVGARFERFSWSSTKQALNRGSRDAQRLANLKTDAAAAAAATTARLAN